MKKIIAITLISLFAISCGRDRAVEKKEGGISVKAVEFKADYGDNDVNKIKEGLKNAVAVLFDIFREAKKTDSKIEGYFVCSFTVEKDGSIRMIMEGENSFNDSGYKAVVEKFMKTSMNNSIKFPPLEKESLITSKFIIK